MSSVEQYITWAALNCTNQECRNLQKKALDENIFAIKQLDSFGKIPSNLLGMNARWQGSWDECINVQAGSNYKGEFCWVGIAPNMDELGISIDSDFSVSCSGTQVQWSVCMPRSCTSDDVKTLFTSLNSISQDVVEFCSAQCLPATTPKKKFWFWLVSGYCLVVGFLIVISSVIDYATEASEKCNYDHLRSKTGMKVLLLFSAYTNGGEILSTKKRPGQINSLNCIRAVSLTWVVIGHANLIYESGDNPLNLLNARNYFLNQVFLNAFPAVDSFLFISGVLLGFLFFKEMSRNRKSLTSPVYWSLYYIHRYIRLSVPYFFFIGFYVMMAPYLIKGPLQVAGDIEMCKKYWWRNVLYISNFFNSSDMCMIHTWYLSTDMWIYSFSPLLLIPLFMSLAVGSIVALLFMILTIAATYATYYKYDFPPTLTGLAFELFSNPEAINPYMKYIYMAPWIRLIPNLMGILTGYILFKLNNKKFRVHWVILLLLWFASAASAIGCIYGLYDYNRARTTLNDFESASYYIFHRVGWSFSLAWTVIACQHNLAGFIKNFMEHGFWMPLARLGYCAYLVHFMVIYVVFSQDKSPLHFTNLTTAYIHAGLPCFLISYAFSFAWSCGFEIPFAKLEKMITTAIVERFRKPRTTDYKWNNNVQPQQSKPAVFDSWQTDDVVQNTDLAKFRYGILNHNASTLPSVSEHL